MATEWQRFDIDIPDNLPASVREDIADDIIEFIKTRTEKGVDFMGRKFPGYSDGYIASLDFKNAGKSKARVNLTLSGDTLASIELLKNKPGKLTIGFEKGSTANAIADGNIRGTYGRSSPDSSVARDFLGISQKDLDKILRRYDV